CRRACWILLARAGRDGCDGLSPNLCGTFDAYKTYAQLDVVEHDGCSYIAVNSASQICQRTASTSGSGCWSPLVAMPEPSRRRMPRGTWSNQRKPFPLTGAASGDLPVSAAVMVSVVAGPGAVRPISSMRRTSP